jgi:hypothetical protein
VIIGATPEGKKELSGSSMADAEPRNQFSLCNQCVHDFKQIEVDARGYQWAKLRRRTKVRKRIPLANGVLCHFGNLSAGRRIQWR